ncbi:hypothetical protein GEMRC1_007765 [Eukaryota sp. GEM-RC1]
MAQRYVLPFIFHPNPCLRKSSCEFISKVVLLIGPIDTYCFIASVLQKFLNISLVSVDLSILSTISNDNFISLSFYNSAVSLLESGNIPANNSDRSHFYLENVEIFADAVLDHQMSPTDFTEKQLNFYQHCCNILGFLTPHLLEFVASKKRINHCRSKSRHNQSVQQQDNLSALSYSKIDHNATSSLYVSPYDSLPASFDMTPSGLYGNQSINSLPVDDFQSLLSVQNLDFAMFLPKTVIPPQ